MQAYSDPKRANDPHALPDVEVFLGPFATAALALADAQSDCDDSDSFDCPTCCRHYDGDDATELRNQQSTTGFCCEYCESDNK